MQLFEIQTRLLILTMGVRWFAWLPCSTTRGPFSLQWFRWSQGGGCAVVVGVERVGGPGRMMNWWGGGGVWHKNCFYSFCFTVFFIALKCFRWYINDHNLLITWVHSSTLCEPIYFLILGTSDGVKIGMDSEAAGRTGARLASTIPRAWCAWLARDVPNLWFHSTLFLEVSREGQLVFV